MGSPMLDDLTRQRIFADLKTWLTDQVGNLGIDIQFINPEIDARSMADAVIADVEKASTANPDASIDDLLNGDGEIPGILDKHKSEFVAECRILDDEINPTPNS